MASVKVSIIAAADGTRFRSRLCTAVFRRENGTRHSASAIGLKRDASVQLIP
ncbi:MAG: hypothetical protein R6V61_07475 [Wenzhouxiangellaceae bacterium]